MPKRKGPTKTRSGKPRLRWFGAGGKKRRVNRGGGTIGKKSRKHGRK